MERVRVLVVDDEPPARSKVRRFLEAETDIEVVGEAGSGTEAVERIRELEPDLVFLDVQMPGLDGFGVLAALDADELPVVVFVTAFDEYALRAFDVHATDYLLKPFDPARFERALGRARAQVAARRSRGGGDAALRELLAALRPAAERSERLERILVREGERSFFVRVEEIDWIEAAENYLYLHADGRKHLVRGTLSGLEKELDPARFVRIHRSHIVNLDRICDLTPWSHGDLQVTLNDGTQLMLSRRYRERLPRVFAQRF
jgi:two-component system, LytTR family, response regulator